MTSTSKWQYPDALSPETKNSHVISISNFVTRKISNFITIRTFFEKNVDNDIFTRTVYTGTKQFSFTLKYPRDEMADRRRDWSRDRVRLTHLITTDPVSWHRVDTLVHAYFSPRSTRTAPQKMFTRKKENGLVRR